MSMGSEHADQVASAIWDAELAHSGMVCPECGSDLYRNGEIIAMSIDPALSNWACWECNAICESEGWRKVGVMVKPPLWKRLTGVRWEPDYRRSKTVAELLGFG